MKALIANGWTPVLVLFVALVVLATMAYVHAPAQAAPVEPEVCEHIATADTIKIYFCDDIDLFVNKLGFMAFEP